MANDDTTTFITALLGEVPEDKHALLWTLQNKRSTWVSLADGSQPVAEAAQRLSDDGMDCYVAVSVANDGGMYDSRIMSKNSAGLMGLWADIDIADPDVHKKWNLPPDEKSALALLDACGAPPTVIVHSGHGLQVWWLFPEFWSFDTEDERLTAASLAQRWNTTLRVRAAEKQWTVDSTFDLARVMRVPGTLNRKGTPVVPVKLLSADGLRWNPDDFEQYMVDDKALTLSGISPTRSYVADVVELSEGAEPPFEKFQALMANDEVFERSWKMQRKDFPDQSPSSYDMSIATQAARAGFTDQEIARTIYAFRRMHRLDVAKALRLDYIQRTISKARDALARDGGAEIMEEVGDAIDAARATGDPEEIKTALRSALDVIGDQLGFQWSQLIKYTSEPASYRLVTPTKSIDLGGNEGLLDWRKMHAAIWEGIGVTIPRFKQGPWDNLTALIPRAWEEQEVGLESTKVGEVSSWLSTYLSQRPPVASLEEGLPSEYPYVDADGRTVIFGPSFKRWLWLQYQEKINNGQLGKRLREFGCTPDKVNVTVEGARTSRSLWKLPADAFKG